jgi:succinate dehydrogenase iron-sulfur subunit
MTAGEKVVFEVFRFNQEKDEMGGVPRYDSFEVETKSGMTVLDALMEIKAGQDGSLTFRYSCRGAVCGSCAVMINRTPSLPCKTQVDDVKGGGLALGSRRFLGSFLRPEIKNVKKGRILIEPLQNLPVIKDLVVDLDRFFKHYESVRPWLVASPDSEKADGTAGSGGTDRMRMSRAEVNQVWEYANCALCAACYGACPAVERDGDYLGPAAILKVWRFLVDPRDTREKELLDLVDSSRGVWGCDLVFRCAEVCPKGVSPTKAVTAIRRKIFASRIKRLVSK